MAASSSEGPRPLTLQLARPDIGFSAAHFSVLDSGSERLHGHNYRVSLLARGSVGADGTVVDFRVLKRALRELCAELDEHTLLPSQSGRLEVREEGDSVAVTEGKRRFVFPREDVVLLPIENTTCECLARHLLQALRARLPTLPVRLELRVDELPGQGAVAAE